MNIKYPPFFSITIDFYISLVMYNKNSLYYEYQSNGFLPKILRPEPIQKGSVPTMVLPGIEPGLSLTNANSDNHRATVVVKSVYQSNAL